MEVNKKLITSIEAAIFGVLAFVMALIPLNIGPFDVELGMVPIIILSYRRGWRTGILAGFLWGIIKLASGNVAMLSVLQVFVEYVFAFAVSGLAGIVWRRIQDSLTKNEWFRTLRIIIVSTSFTVFVKYTIHFIAGVIYWGIYAPDTMNPFIYSLFINGISAILTVVIVVSVTSFIIYKAPELILVEK